MHNKTIKNEFSNDPNASLVSKVHYFYDLERICNVLSIHGIKRACVWHTLES